MTDTDVITRDPKAGLDDPLAHLCCVFCRVTACGAGPGKRRAPPDAPKCVVCLDLGPTWVHACPEWVRATNE